MLTLETFTQKVEAGDYETAINASRALAHVKLTKRNKAAARQAIEAHFSKGNKGSDESSERPQGTRKRVAGAMHGFNGIGKNGEGDCLAVTMCEIACDAKARDQINRLLSQGREENVTLPELSSQFARMCQAIGGR